MVYDALPDRDLREPPTQDRLARLADLLAITADVPEASRRRLSATT
jgi:hypothetical protein